MFMCHKCTGLTSSIGYSELHDTFLCVNVLSCLIKFIALEF